MRFCWHSWGKWSPVIEDYDGNLHQVCICTKCNAVERRKAISCMVAQLQSNQINDIVNQKQ